MSSFALPRARAVPIAYAYGLLGVVGATVLAVSAYYLYHLALAVRIPPELAWSLPVALDIGAAAGAVCWIIAEEGTRFYRCGLGLALACLAGTLVGNGLSHLIDFGVIRVGPWLAVATCSVYPAVAATLVHLVLLLRREQSAPAVEAVEVAEDASGIDPAPAVDASLIARAPTFDASPIDPPAPWPAVEASPIDPPAIEAPADDSADASEPPAPKRRRITTAAQRRRWINAELDNDRDVTGGQVERRFGSRNGAREVAQVKAEREAAATEGEVA